MTDKWKMQFSESDVNTLKIVLVHTIAQNQKAIDGGRNELYAIDKVAHRVCRDDCQHILDYITSTTG